MRAGPLIARAAVAALLIHIGIQQVRYSLSYGNDVTWNTDQFSEGNSIRAGHHYAVAGLWSNAGLPDVAYGPLLRDYGVTKKDPTLTTYVYTHYPPGPDWLLGLLSMIFGPGEIVKFRMVRIAFALCFAALLAILLDRGLGPVRGAIGFVAMVELPMFTQYMHGLSIQGWDFELLYLQLAILLIVFGRSPCKLERREAIALFVLGFLQGWVGFDYVFLLALAAVPFWLLTSRRTETLPTLRRAIVWPVTGFVLACGLHFLQVVIYYRGLQPAIRDLGGAAAHRADISAGIAEAKAVWLDYVLRRLPEGRYFGFSFVEFVIVLTVALALPFPKFHWNPARASVAAFLASLAIASLWVVIMKGHAIEHPHFIPRHFFMVYFFGVVLTLKAIRAPADLRATR